MTPLTQKVQKLTEHVKDLPLDERVDALNELKELLHELSPFAAEPVDCVLWVKNDLVQANDYNPNAVAPPEMKLLEISIDADGYTQPIVADFDATLGKLVVVDGFHRHRVGRESKIVASRVQGYLPIVQIREEVNGRADRIASTIRHNRARGKHQVDQMSKIVVELTEGAAFPFFWPEMEFEEFVPLFGKWYGQGERTACFVGIRTDESLNRFRTIALSDKETWQGRRWTSRVGDGELYNIYPIYDWHVDDLWTYHAKFPERRHNRLYDLMHQAGLTPHQMRICQPYGDDQRRNLWLYHVVEPQTWARVVARVNGANGGALYVQEWGNINGYRRVTKPPGHTWQTFAEMLVGSMPPKSREHYRNKVLMFTKWWTERGYTDGIPDEADYDMEAQRKAPSWRRVCKTLLRNDYWGKGLGFSQQKSEGYEAYLKLMRKRKAEWKVQEEQMQFAPQAQGGEAE